MTTLIDVLPIGPLINVLSRVQEKEIALEAAEVAAIKASLKMRKEAVAKSLLKRMGQDSYVASLKDETAFWHDLVDADPLVASLLKAKDTHVGASLDGKGRGSLEVELYVRPKKDVDHFLKSMGFLQSHGIPLTEGYAVKAAEILRRLSDVYTPEARSVEGTFEKVFASQKWSQQITDALDIFESIAAFEELQQFPQFAQGAHRFAKRMLSPQCYNMTQLQRTRMEDLAHKVPGAVAIDLQVARNDRALRDVDAITKATGRAVDAFIAAVRESGEAMKALQPIASKGMLRDTGIRVDKAFQEKLPLIARAVARSDGMELMSALTATIKGNPKLARAFLAQFGEAVKHDPDRVAVAALALKM